MSPHLMHAIDRLARAAALLLSVMFVNGRVSATSTAMPNTVVHELPRSANGQTYVLYVALPSDYQTNITQRYPALYFPDGYWDFWLMASTAGNLRADSALPGIIVVGIGYAGDSPNYSDLRAVDLTPGVDPLFDPTGVHCGRASAFLSVIANEIIPFIEGQYRVDSSYRVLAGNSFGGLFTTYVAFERPELFQGYIASSPSLWWRGSFLAAREREYALQRHSFPVRLFFGYASGDGSSIINSTQELYRQMQSHAYPDLAIAMREMEGERHSSTKAEAFTRGLRFTFAPVTLNPSLGGTTMRSTLINISTRGTVGTGDRVLIAGFVVNGFERKRVLVRAIGPTLANLDVTDVLLDPRFQVHSSAGGVVAGNDNWEPSTEMTTAVLEAGTFPFPAGSRDAAAVLTLDPGTYTAVVSGVNDTTGNAVVEVYELP